MHIHFCIDLRMHILYLFLTQCPYFSPVFRKFMAREVAPFFAVATELARRFLPSRVTDQQAVVGALWLFGQCSIFVRNAEQLANPPLRLKIDERFVDGLADTIAAWAAEGLGRLPAQS